MLDEEILRWLVIVSAGSIVVSGMEITYEQHALFPTLYKLDDYNNCLGPRDGLYCVGTFHIRPLKEYDATYELMKEYSQDHNNFNRTLIHRGYCVSSRCPSLSHIHNTAQRFERCIAQDLKRQSFNTTLTELKYCRTHAEEYDVLNNRNNIQTSHWIFGYTVLMLLAMNLVGTLYDVMKGSEIRKSKILTSWSIKSNWQQLVCPYPEGHPRLAASLPIEGFRVVMIMLVIFTHAGCIHDSLYIANPKLVEEMSHYWIMMALQNGTSSIQLFLLLSSFLLAQNLLTVNSPNIKTVAKLLLKRIFRIAPVYLLVISFAATWYPYLNNGPLWHSTVSQESLVCRQKFWSHVFFLHNFFEPQKHCIASSWFLAVDMQLYLLGSILMLCLAKVKRLALPILAVGFVSSVILNSCLSYIYNWKPMMFVSGPENVRHLYLNEPSFYEYYTNPLSCIPTMMVGIFVAHLHHHLQEKGFKTSDHKWLFFACQMSFLLIPMWTTSGHFWRGFKSREFSAIYIAFERPVTLILGGVLLFGAYYGNSKGGRSPQKSSTATKGFLKHIFSWRIWYPLGRSSLTVMILHWCINMTIKASTLQPITSTALSMMVDTVASAFFTYILAMPITLLVEIPFIKIYSAITISKKED